MRFEFIPSIQEISAERWDALWPNNYPFTRHAFFRALEESNSTTAKSGWQPSHCTAYEGDKLVFVLPLFIKTHSYGEYVFDWGWADAYARSGLEYYPKLLNAIPFTPATGPRWASQTSLSKSAQLEITDALFSHARAIGASSFHCLFPSLENRNFFQEKDTVSFIQRDGYQYHWFNQNYTDFEDFLNQFSSRKRKNIRKERKKCDGIDIKFYSGHDATQDQWALFYQLYHRTYLKRSGRPGYLGPQFFSNLAQSMPEHILLALAELDGQFIAGAVYFKDDDTLYGRYWGTLEDIDGLHFETCYYQGIEYAIKHKLSRFDPGAQGEHKIQRGFQPIKTCSFHWLADPRFQHAVHAFCESEKNDVSSYIEDARGYLPFKENTPLVPSCILLGKS